MTGKLRIVILSFALAMRFSVLFGESGERFYWPLDAATSSVLLRPGYRLNPIDNSAISNHSYFISGKKDEIVYAPESGVVDWWSEFMIVFPSGESAYTYDEPDDVRKAYKLYHDPVFSEVNATKFISIKMADGRTLHVQGLSLRTVKKGQSVKKGEPVGRLGYIPTFSRDPCLSLSLGTNKGQVDETLGMLLLGEDNHDFYASLRKRSFRYSPDRLLTRQEALDAWAILKRTIEEDHPALLDPEIRDTVLADLREGENTIAGPISVGALRTLMQRSCASLHCSHTKIKPFDTSWQSGLLPLELVLHEGRCYVVWDKRKTEKIPVATEITAINGISITEWISRLLPLVTIDSRADSVRGEYLERNFSSMLEVFLQPTSQLTVTCLGSGGEKIGKTIPLFRQPQLGDITWPTWMTSRQDAFQLIDENSAILKLWSIDDAADKEKMESYFRSISDRHIRNLVLDLRGNQGGSEDNTAFLYSFFAAKSFSLYESTEIRHGGQYRSFKYSINNAVQQNAPYPIALSDYQQLADGKYRLVNRIVYAPSSRYVYTGNIWVLLDAYTVSAAVNFSRLLAENNNAIIVGTETSGGFYACNADKDNIVLLGESGLTLRMPMIRVVFTNSSSLATPIGSGLVPRFTVPKTLNDKLYGSDSQMDFVRAHIAELSVAP